MSKSTALLAAQLRAKALASIWSGATWFRVDDLTTLADVTTDDVRAWLQDRKLFALVLNGEDYVPDYAVDGNYKPRAVIAGVLKVQQDRYSDVAIAAWFDSTSSYLDGARPRELVTIDPDRILACARDCIDTEQYAG